MLRLATQSAAVNSPSACASATRAKQGRPEEAADWAGTTTSYISKIETAKHSVWLAHIKLLLQLYGVDRESDEISVSSAKPSSQLPNRAAHQLTWNASSTYARLPGQRFTATSHPSSTRALSAGSSAARRSRLGSSRCSSSITSAGTYPAMISLSSYSALTPNRTLMNVVYLER